MNTFKKPTITQSLEAKKAHLDFYQLYCDNILIQIRSLLVKLLHTVSATMFCVCVTK